MRTDFQYTAFLHALYLKHSRLVNDHVLHRFEAVLGAVSCRTDTKVIKIAGATAISSIQVSLNIDGEEMINGDYYAYLRHGDTGFAVLLNRPGATASNPYGYFDSGLNVVFADDAKNGDIHNYQTVLNPNGGALSGIWQPDGRRVDPSDPYATTRSAYLSSFIGADPNGDWTLFVADNSAVGVGTLTGWGLTITAEVTAVPEPSTFAALAVAAVLYSVKLRADRQSQKSRPVKE